MSEMNRREMLKLGVVGEWRGWVECRLKVRCRWRQCRCGRFFEVTLAGPSTGHSFVEVQVGAECVMGHCMVRGDGFYEGAGVYKVRFMPDTEGTWSYTTQSNVAGLKGKTGSFVCRKAMAGAHGPVVVWNIHHFAYADGTAHFPFG